MLTWSQQNLGLEHALLCQVLIMIQLGGDVTPLI